MTSTMLTAIDEDRVRLIVREETRGLRADVEILKSDMGEVKRELYRFGVLQEDMRGTLDTVLEIVRDLLGRQSNPA